MKSSLGKLNLECKNNISKFNNDYNKYKQFYWILLNKLCNILSPNKYNFLGIKNRRSMKIDKCKDKLNKYKFIIKFILKTLKLNNKLDNNAPNYCGTIHISSKSNNKPRNIHYDKSNHSKYPTILSGLTINTHEKNNILIENKNGSIKRKLIKNIDGRGRKSKSPFKSRYKNELIKFKKFSYYKKFFKFNAFKKLHYGERINKGKRITIIIYTISDDILKTTKKYKNYHKYILNL